MRGDSNERLTILSEAEKTALYGIPGFDDFQRVEFFAMTEAERSLVLQRRGILKQVYCLLQIGYFKAKHAFFKFSLDGVPPEDVTFLLQRYFPGETLSTLTAHHRTHKAIFEFDRLIRSIYTLRYLRDSQLQRDVHRSENRIESYHQLRSTIAKVNGKKELAGRTDLDVAISNYCDRLVENVVIAYNSILLSGVLGRYLATGNEKALDLLRRISPVAWQHLHPRALRLP